MASNTENLNLLMKNPSTDGAETFNVDTMLNENWRKIDNNAGTVAQTLANILKPTTPPIIGLPPSTTPDGMFRALGNTGELHVWRKTVVSSSEQPAGYTLGDVITNSEIWVENRYEEAVFHYATSISVSDAGLVSLVGEKTATIGHSNNGENIAEFDVFKGKFVYISGGDNNKRQFIFYIPANATFHRDGNYSTNKIYADKEQRVNAHGIIPAGTTTTYPVSINPNAYQEGNNGKPAGYTLGEVATGSFRMGASNVSYPYLYYVSSALSVADDGTISIDSSTATQIKMGYSESWTTDTWKTTIAGKFVQYKEQIGASSGTSSPDKIPPFNTRGIIVFIPSDVEVSKSDSAYYIDRYQPVTGYATIPAGTTIEYLGKLGDKARVQVVSYVGTGTYGSDHPNSLTFDFVPKAVFLFSSVDASRCIVAYGETKAYPYENTGYNIEVSWNKKAISWYSYDGAKYQLNLAGKKYYAIVIG